MAHVGEMRVSIGNPRLHTNYSKPRPVTVTWSVLRRCRLVDTAKPQDLRCPRGFAREETCVAVATRPGYKSRVVRTGGEDGVCGCLPRLCFLPSSVKYQLVVRMF